MQIKSRKQQNYQYLATSKPFHNCICFSCRIGSHMRYVLPAHQREVLVTSGGRFVPRELPSVLHLRRKTLPNLFHKGFQTLLQARLRQVSAANEIILLFIKIFRYDELVLTTNFDDISSGVKTSFDDEDDLLQNYVWIPTWFRLKLTNW